MKENQKDKGISESIFFLLPKWVIESFVIVFWNLINVKFYKSTAISCIFTFTSVSLYIIQHYTKRQLHVILVQIQDLNKEKEIKTPASFVFLDSRQVLPNILKHLPTILEPRLALEKITTIWKKSSL